MSKDAPTCPLKDSRPLLPEHRPATPTRCDIEPGVCVEGRCSLFTPNSDCLLLTAFPTLQPAEVALVIDAINKETRNTIVRLAEERLDSDHGGESSSS